MLVLKKTMASVAIVLNALLTVGQSVAHAHGFHLYSEPNYRGHLIVDKASAMTSPVNITGGWGDTASSQTNDTSFSIALAHGLNLDLTNHCFTVAPGQVDARFWWFDDNQVSSYQIGRVCPK